MSYDIQFTDYSNAGNNQHPITKYRWDFGDYSGNSTERNPCHTYNSAGLYTIKLTVTNDCGESATYDKAITLGGEKMTTYIEGFIVSGSTRISMQVTTREDSVPLTFLDAGSDEEISNEEVELLDTDLGLLQTETTDADGKVSFTNLAHGNYYVRIDGYTQKIEVKDSNNRSINVAKMEPAIEVEFKDTNTEEPITNKKAELLNRDLIPTQETVTNAEGIAVFTNVPHGRYSARLTY